MHNIPTRGAVTVKHVAPQSWRKLKEQFREQIAKDPHAQRAASIFGEPATVVTEDKRAYAKASSYREMYCNPPLKKGIVMKVLKAPRTAEEQTEYARHKHMQQMRTLLADALGENKPLQVFSSTKWQWEDLKPCDSFNLKNKYRIKHKWQAEIDAFNRGEKIEYRNNTVSWGDASQPSWFTLPGHEYRVKPKPRTFYLYQFTSYPALGANLRFIVSQDEPTSSHIKEYGIGGTATFKRDELTYLHTVQINQG